MRISTSSNQAGMGAAVVAVAAGGRNIDLESLEPLVEPAYCAVSVKPSITTLTWIEARGNPNEKSV